MSPTIFKARATQTTVEATAKNTIPSMFASCLAGQIPGAAMSTNIMMTQ